MHAPASAPQPSASALLASAMFRSRPRAKSAPGTLVVVEDAGYQRRLAWRVNADGTETLSIRRRFLSPSLADFEDMVENLPPGLVVLGSAELPDKDDWKGCEYTLGSPPPPPEPEPA